MYPEPTVFSVHSLVPLTEEGDRVGALLAEDPELRALATRHGFRAEGGDAFADLVAEHGLPVRTRVDEVSVLSRNTQGVRLIKLKTGEHLKGLERIEESEDGMAGTDAGEPAAE
jgi:DNA gyrase/topoisomerase IV subunit A